LSPIAVANVAKQQAKPLILLDGGEGVRRTILHLPPTPFLASSIVPIIIME